MSLQTVLTTAFQRIGVEFNSIRTERGVLANLITTAKTSIVDAINEVATSANNAAVINDGATNTTEAWSGNKVNTEITTAVDNLLNGAGAAYDTLQELATEIQGNDTDIASILTGQANRVAVDAAQSFSAAQQTQARANIDAQSATEIGSTTHEFTADFTGALT